MPLNFRATVLAMTMTMTGCAGLLGCTTTEPVATGERQAMAIRKALYDAYESDPFAVTDPDIPWPDDYLWPSTTYEGCAEQALHFGDSSDNVFRLKALEVCERRHLEER